MFKKLPLLTAALLVSTIVLGGCTLGQKSDAETMENIIENSENESFTGNIKGLIGLGKSQKCTWEGEDGESGVVYTDGTKSRFEANGIMVSDFNNENPEEKGSMYSINDGEYIYSWSSASSEGMKMKFDLDDVQEQMEDVDYPGYMDDMDDMDDYEEEDTDISEDDYNYSCSGWKVDEKMFVPPTNITFKDFSLMMDNLKSELEGMESMCDLLEGEEKMDCITVWAESQALKMKK